MYKVCYQGIMELLLKHASLGYDDFSALKHVVLCKQAYSYVEHGANVMCENNWANYSYRYS